MWRAVLEAIGYDYMEITDTYRASGVPLKRITVTEGGSRDSLWNQIKADMLASDVRPFPQRGRRGRHELRLRGSRVGRCEGRDSGATGHDRARCLLRPNPANSELTAISS